MLEDNFKYYLKNQDELVKKYNGKFIVIKDNKVVDVYETYEDAYFESETKYELGTFIIQHCLPGDESYTHTFHSRVITN